MPAKFILHVIEYLAEFGCRYFKLLFAFLRKPVFFSLAAALGFLYKAIIA